MYAAIMPLWRSNKGHLIGASCGHKGRHRPESKFYRLILCSFHWKILIILKFSTFSQNLGFYIRDKSGYSGQMVKNINIYLCIQGPFDKYTEDHMSCFLSE